MARRSKPNFRSSVKTFLRRVAIVGLISLTISQAPKLCERISLSSQGGISSTCDFVIQIVHSLSAEW